MHFEQKLLFFFCNCCTFEVMNTYKWKTLALPGWCLAYLPFKICFVNQASSYVLFLYFVSNFFEQDWIYLSCLLFMVKNHRVNKTSGLLSWIYFHHSDEIQLTTDFYFLSFCNPPAYWCDLFIGLENHENFKEHLSPWPFNPALWSPKKSDRTFQIYKLKAKNHVENPLFDDNNFILM